MARAYKAITETQGKNRPCLRCFHCKTRVFRDLNELIGWCRKKDLIFSRTWKKRFRKNKIIQIYWCDISSEKALYIKPRIFRLSDKPFRIDCKLFNGGDVDGII